MCLYPAVLKFERNNMKALRKLFVLFFIILVLCSACLPAYAAVADIPPATTAEEGEGIEPRADVIVFKYRIYNGVYQYRRWNETKGYWVDPYWIDV